MDLRRRLVLLISALLMFALCSSVVWGVVALTQGVRGREVLRAGAERVLRRVVDGEVYLGAITGSLVTDLTIDSIEIRERAGDPVIATGPIRLSFDPRDLLAGRVLIRSVAITRPRVDLRQDADGRWNVQEVFPPSETPARHRGRGELWSLIVLEQVRVEQGGLAITRPWVPSAEAEPERGQAIQRALAGDAPEIRRDGRAGFRQTIRWSAVDVEVPRLRLAHPDSLGLSLRLGQLAAAQSFPALAIRQLSGSVRLATDTLWVEVPRIRTAHSTVRLTGLVALGDSLGPMVRMRINADSIGLRDLRGFSSAIPSDGTLRFAMDLRSRAADPGAFEVGVTDLDFRARGIRIRGKGAAIAGGDVPRLRDIDLQVQTLDLAALGTLRSSPLPIDGVLSGRIRIAGGPLDRVRIDRVVAQFRDRAADGAASALQLRGEVDLSALDAPVLRGLLVQVDSLDLRSLRAIDSGVPAIAGHLVAAVRLDSTFRDLRFSALDLRHRDGASTPTQLTGSGRLRLGDVPSIEAELLAIPLALGTLAQSIPAISLRDNYTGPLRVVGRLDSLAVTTELTAPSGRLVASVITDVQAPVYRLTGQATVSDLRPRLAFADTTLPDGVLSFRLSTDVGGDSLRDLLGEASVTLARSQVENVRVFGGTMRLRVADGVLFIDTVSVESTALDLSAAGALGLLADVRDSLLVSARIDSLGGFRRWVTRSAADSIAGRVRLTGVVAGWVGGFELRGALDGNELVIGRTRAQQMEGQLRLAGFPDRPIGGISVGVDTANVAGFGLTRAFTRAVIDSAGVAHLELQVTGAGGTLARAQGRLERRGEETFVGVDSLVIATGLQRWVLEGGTRVARRGRGLSLEPVLIRGGTGSTIRIEGGLPAVGAVALRASARQLPLADVAELLQIGGRQEGSLDIDAALGGSRLTPRLSARATMAGGLLAGLRIDSLATTVEGSAETLRLTGRLGRGERPALRADAELPFRLRLDGSPGGLVDSAPVRVTVRSDSVSLRVFEPLRVSEGADPGTFALNLDVGGTWAQPRVDGGLVVRNGTLRMAPLGEVVWRDVTADIGVIGDSIAIRRVAASSRSDGKVGRGSVGGWFSFADRQDPRFDVAVRAERFHVYNVRNVADIDVSDSLRLSGALTGATLTGGITVNRALVTIPEVTTKNVVSLETFDRFGAVDSVATAQRLLPARSTSFLDNLQIRNVPVRMGRDVRLFSKDEANIFLGGAVSITRSRLERVRAGTRTQLALTGALQTVRGTYTLNLGPVSRKFELERGEVEFFGEPELNPSLDISAIHTIRQYSKQGSQPDVRIRVTIGGTLLQPTLALSTPDSARVKNADLISYLVTGGPSFEIGAEQSDYTSTAARLLIGSLGGFLSGKAAGGLCDDAVLSSSAADQKQKGLANVGSSVLEGMRFNCAKALNERTFVRLDAGLCQVGQFVSGGGMGTAASLANSIGVKLDYIVRPQLTVSAGVEPPTSAVLCAQNVSARGFVPTPQQWGVDLFYAWRF